MKTASLALQSHIAQQYTTLTTCLKITRTDGVVLAFSALDQEFTFESVLHKVGYDPTAVASADQMNVDNMEWQGVVDHDDITSEDIIAGKYDGAAWETYKVNWADLTQGRIILKTGTIGNVNLNYPNEFVAEGRSLMQALQVKIGMHYTPHCKWDLGDGRCRFKLVGTIGQAGEAGTVIPVWQASHIYIVGDLISPTVPNGFTYVCVTAGTSAATEPVWANFENDTEAGLQSYLTNPGLTDNKAYIITPAETGSYVLTGPAGEVGSARWAFLTDGIRVAHQISPLTNTLGVANDGHWKTQNDILSGQIEATANGGATQYALTLNTFNDAVYACDEVDLLLCAVSPLPDVTVNEPGILPFAQQEFLGALTGLTLTWTQGVTAAVQGTRCASGVNVAITMISVYFKNTVTNETLQYQIYTYDSRGFLPDATWFASTGPFYGVADNISRYGGSYLNVGGSASFTADILARVLALMVACPNPAIDENPDHWKITLLSVGPFTNGEASITSTVSNVNMIANTPTAIINDIPDGTVIWHKSGVAPSDGLTLASVAPSSGVVGGGTSVTLTGTGFATGMTVTFGGTAAIGVSVVSPTVATATTPAHAASAVNVVVTNPNTNSATLTNGFTYAATPPAGTFAVTDATPDSGPPAGGTRVSVIGTGFVAGASVSFGGLLTTGITFINSTLIIVTTFAHVAGVVNVVVTNPDLATATLSGGFTYTNTSPPPPGENRSFITPFTVATVIDARWEFTATTTGTPLVTDSQVHVPFWQPKHLYWPGDSVRPTDTTNKLRAVVASAVWDEKDKTKDVPSGTSGSSQPTWPAEGERIEDNEVEWVMVKDHWYKDGVLKFTTGDNAGLAKQFEVLLYEVTGSSARFRLVLPTPFPIQVGDKGIVEAGCDKTVPTCTYKFDNILNFGGEPHVAGFNRSHDTPTDENLQSS